MRYKKIMVLAIILTCLLAVSVVSAADNATDDIITADVASEDVIGNQVNAVENGTDNAISANDDNQVITEGNDSDVGSFADLQTEINNVEEGGVLNLTKDYKYVNGSTEGISINKPITIDGQGHTLDGNGLSRIFYVSSSNVVLKNMNFVNGNYQGNGGAIYWSGNNGKLVSCDFVNCYVYPKYRSICCGGAIYWQGNDGQIIGSNFMNNTAFAVFNKGSSQGGAIYCQGNNMEIGECNFSSNYALDSGAIFSSLSYNMIINNSIFFNNSALGSAVTLNENEKNVISNCYFFNNSASLYDAGAIFVADSNHCLIVSCKFINNSADNHAGAIMLNGIKNNVSNCIFLNNFAASGGAIYSTCSSYNSILNCNFTENNATWGNTFKIDDSDNFYIYNCNFGSKSGSIWVDRSSLKIENSSFYPNLNNVISGDSDISFIKKNLSIFCNNISFEYNYPKEFIVSSESNVELIFKFYKHETSKQLSLNTTNGVVTLLNELNELSAGIWNVTVIFEGNDNYAPCNATATITVLPLASSVTVDDINASWDSKTTFTAHVLSNTTPVNEGTVSFYICDEFIGDASVINGTAVLTHEVPGTLGEHNIAAIFNSNNYLSSNNTAKLLVNSGDMDVSQYENIATFKELSGLIENTPEGAVLNLTKDYIYASGSTEGISINKPMTIDGQGHTLDGNKLSRIFNIYSDNVILKNIYFKNGFAYGSGGSIYGIGNNCSIQVCSFLNSSASSTGGAVSFNGDENMFESSVLIENSAFVNNSARFGGAICTWFCKSFILNCAFINNTASYETVPYNGNSICWDVGCTCLVNNSHFSSDFNNFDGDEWNDKIIIIKKEAVLYSKSISFNYGLGVDFTIQLTDNSDNNLTNQNIQFILSKNNDFKTFNKITGSHGVCLLSDELNDLTVGTWNVTVLFEGNDNYAPCNATATITVLQPSSSVTIADVNSTVGHEITLVANVSSDLTVNEGVVSFFDGSTQIGESPVSNGTATLTYTPTTAGEHAITAIFNSSNYLSSNDTSKLLVDYSAIEILVNNGVVDYNMDITARITSPDNITIEEGIVVFFDGETQIGESAVSNGIATITYTPTTAGEHNVTAKYKLDNSEDSTYSILFNVSKADIDLSIDNIVAVYFSNPSNFAVNVNSNSNRVNEGEIKYYVNNILIGSSSVYDGSATWSYVANATGSFNLEVVFNETDNYLAKNASATFYVDKMPTTLSGESVIFDEQAYKTFTTELKDDNRYGVAGQLVKIELIKYSGESATFTGVSDGSGVTFYDVGNLDGGMWYVSGIYSGNENYIRSSFADKFIVVRLDTTTDIEEISNAQVNHSYKIKANIHDENGKLVKEGIVQFYLDGVDIGSIDLSQNQGHQSALSEGVLGAVNPMFEDELGADASDLYLNYVPTKAGKHTLTAVYEGTTIYKSSNSTTTFDVKDGVVPTSITASGITVAFNSGKYIVATLKDSNGNPLKNVKVTVKIGTKTLTPTTDKNGQVKISADSLAPVKKYTVAITFAGNNNYAKSTKSVKVSVVKANLKVTPTLKKYKANVKPKKYYVTVKNSKNQKLKNIKVSLTVKGRTFSAYTLKNGVATLKVTNLLKKGTYKAYVSFAGNNYYNKLTKKVYITVK